MLVGIKNMSTILVKIAFLNKHIKNANTFWENIYRHLTKRIGYQAIEK